MPELPEVETTLRGIEPYVYQRAITDIVVRESRMRWPVPTADLKALIGRTVTHIERRAKYILMHTDAGVILLHLGMSGSLRVLKNGAAKGVEKGAELGKHDHIDLCFDNNAIVRFNDPRRFGCCLLIQQPINEHKLILKLGPEPLSDSFNSDYLYSKARQRSAPIKNVIMDGHVVVGVGNIYASEALYESGIRPTKPANKIGKKRIDRLTQEIRAVLAKAIKAGGTTLKDFTQTDGKPGYFRHELQVYGRKGENCYRCGSQIKSLVLGQRNTFYCGNCQR